MGAGEGALSKGCFARHLRKEGASETAHVVPESGVSLASDLPPASWATAGCSCCPLQQPPEQSKIWAKLTKTDVSQTSSDRTE